MNEGQLMGGRPTDDDHDDHNYHNYHDNHNYPDNHDKHENHDNHDNHLWYYALVGTGLALEAIIITALASAYITAINRFSKDDNITYLFPFCRRIRRENKKYGGNGNGSTEEMEMEMEM